MPPSRTLHQTQDGVLLQVSLSRVLFKMCVVEGNLASSGFVSFYRTPAILHVLIWLRAQQQWTNKI